MQHNVLVRPRNRKDAADYIKQKHGRPCSKGLLDKLAVTGKGPIFRKISGRFVVYEEPALDEWCADQIGPPQRSTSETPARRPQAADANAEAV